MPRYSQTSPDVATLCPMKFPFVVLIVSKYENSAADDTVHAESQVMAIGKPYISGLVSSKCEKSRKDVEASKKAWAVSEFFRPGFTLWMKAVPILLQICRSGR
jgi:hypothetical protein